MRRSNVAAIRLYESLGFEVADVRRRYYTQPEEDALILTSRIAPANTGGGRESRLRNRTPRDVGYRVLPALMARWSCVTVSSIVEERLPIGS